MKIDLHCHTKKIKKGDAPTRNVDVEMFKEKVALADVQIVAITNHNHFDIEQFRAFQDAVDEYCILWPGIELDIQGKENRGHLIVIANPDNVVLFNEKVQELLGSSDVDSFMAELSTVYNLLEQCDVIYIPHFHKEPKLSEDDIEELNGMLKDKSRLFKETSDYRSLGVFSNFDYSMIIGSDVQDWSQYENSKFADIRLPINTFKQFCLLANKDKQIIDTLLNKKTKTIIDVYPHKTVHFPIYIYQDINILFGQKGTGKTEILNSLKNYYEGKSIKYKIYVGNTKENDFKKLLDISEMKRDVTKFGIDDYKDKFAEIAEWQDKKPIAIKNYIDWMETKDNNKNKSKMKITNAVAQDVYVKDKQIDKDYTSFKDFTKSSFLKIPFEHYLSTEEVDMFQNLMSKLGDEIYVKKLHDWKKSNEVKLVNFSIDKIKAIADKCSDTVSKPSNTGFTEFALNRLDLLEKAICLEGVFETPQIQEKEYLGEIEGKGDVYIEKRYRLLCGESRKEEFSKGITKLKECKKIISHIRDRFFEQDIAAQIIAFKELYEDDGIKDISYFIGVSKRPVLENGDEYQPSNGERGILLLQRMLDDDADVYILDEPELGMGNSYINSAILPKLIKLSKSRKTIIVATHNANIAVRTLPYVSIFRTHENGKYATYVGNPFRDELVNIEDVNDVKNWTLESMHTLEGGRDAFYQRKDIYESGRKDN